MSLSAFFVRNGNLALLLLLAGLGLGALALTSMPRGEDPPFGAPIFVITVVYPGTTPADMEQLVVDPLEEELYNLDDVNFVRTNIVDGVAVMRVEFEYGVDVDKKETDVTREVNAVRPELPEGILRLDVERAASDDVVVLQAALVSETAGDGALLDLAEDLERRLGLVPGTKWVRLDAEPTEEVEVSLDADRLREYGLTTARVLQALRGSNVNVPGGALDLGERRFSVSTNSAFEGLDDLRAAVVAASPTGGVLTLDDVATVRLRTREDAPRARYNGRRALWVNQAVRNEANLLAVRREAQVQLDGFGESLPPDVELHVAFDNATSVEHRLGSLGRDFLIAIGLVLITLLPLGPRASIVVMISIPLSLGIGMGILYYAGYTLNQLSIVGLVVALGLVVDDSIVVVENVERHLREGMGRMEAAIAATREIGIPVVGCTVVLLLAFLPLARLPGGPGEFIVSLPVAVLVTVAASLLVALTLAPWLGSRLLRAHDAGEGGNVFFRAFRRYVNDPYQRVLEAALRHPAIALLGAGLVFGASLLLLPLIGSSLFPDSERPMFLVDVEATPGSTLDDTDRLARGVERYLLAQPEVASVNLNVGSGHPRVFYNTFQRAFRPNQAQALVQLRERGTLAELKAVTDRFSAELSRVPDARVRVRRFAQGPPVEAPIDYRIVGPDLDTLERIATDLEALLRETPGTEYVTNDARVPRTELAVRLDWDRAGRYGLPPAEVARSVRLGVAGLPVGELRTAGGDDYPIVVGMGRARDVEVFDHIAVPNVQGRPVLVGQVASVGLAASAPEISHYNKQRYASVSAFAKTGYNVFALFDELRPRLREIVLPKGYRIDEAGEAETQAESTGGVGGVIGLAVFGILAVLVLEFRTFKSTLIVLSVVPLGIVGALVALYLTGETLGFVATIGMIALVGIEIKNSILMVDFTNQLRERGMGLREAVLEGAETRFLPILLTAATAIGGLTPIALEGSPLVSPLAYVLIGGLLSSTLLSRVVTPVLYYLLPPRVGATGEASA